MCNEKASFDWRGMNKLCARMGHENKLSFTFIIHIIHLKIFCKHDDDAAACSVMTII